MHRDAERWCIGRSWIMRVPVVFYLAYVGLALLTDPAGRDRVFYPLTMAAHDIGHVIFSYSGAFYEVIGGPLGQVVLPAAAVIFLYQRRHYFASTVALGLLGYSLLGLAMYIGDAQSQTIVANGVVEDTMHEWNYILTTTNTLYMSRSLSGLSYVAGGAAWLGALFSGGWLCMKMAVSRQRGHLPLRYH